MKTPNEFWLCLHQLAESYRAEGLTPPERAEAIVDEFQRMPGLARQEMLADLRVIGDNIGDLTMVVRATQDALELRPPNRASG